MALALPQIDKLVASIPTDVRSNVTVYEYHVFLLLTRVKKTAVGADSIHWVRLRNSAAELTPIMTRIISITLPEW